MTDPARTDDVAPWRRSVNGVDVHFTPATQSTQDDLRALIGDGAPHLTMVSAGQQVQGRGRAGRSWASPPGNLYTSTLLRPQPGWSSPLHAAFVAALAVAATVDRFAGDRGSVRIKWPNDVLVDGGKISGILLEAGNARVGADGGLAVDWLMLGVGLNVVSKPAPDLYPTACLADFCAPAPALDQVRAVYCDALVAQLAAWPRDGFAAVRQRVLTRMAGIGGPATVRVGDRTEDRVSGRFEGLDPDGALILDTEAGRRVITTGDVFLGPIAPVA